VATRIEERMRRADDDARAEQDFMPVVDHVWDGRRRRELRGVRIDQRWQVLTRRPDIAVQVRPGPVTMTVFISSTSDGILSVEYLPLAAAA
jgi:hypothetical protein